MTGDHYGARTKRHTTKADSLLLPTPVVCPKCRQSLTKELSPEDGTIRSLFCNDCGWAATKPKPKKRKLVTKKENFKS